MKGLEINRASHRIIVNGKEVKLASKEYEIIFLASNPNIVLYIRQHMGK